ncbi:uncharacterized protein [Asterias amurensis]|uniref:uncharacterized protein n=1 Tax=Asterias amurensis TaxID=7602 RepID=UPI003AB54371
MKSVVLVVVMMGFAAASAMFGADSGLVAEEARGDKSTTTQSCPELTLNDFSCPACKLHLNALLTEVTFNDVIHTYCNTIPREPERSGRARARCFALASSDQVENMVTSTMVDKMCENGLRCP